MWQERARDCAASRRYSASPRGLSVTASCGIQFTLDGSLFTQGDGVNKEQFNHRLPPLFSFSPSCMQNDGIKGKRVGGRKRRKSCETNHSQAEECLIWTWTVKVQRGAKMCVFVIKQVWVFYLREQTGEKADLPVRALCFTLLFLMLHDHKHQFSPASLQPRHCPRPLTTAFCLEDSPFWFVFFFKTNALILRENRCSRSLI